MVVFKNAEAVWLRAEGVYYFLDAVQRAKAVQELEILTVPNEPNFFHHMLAPFVVEVPIDPSSFVVEVSVNLFIGLDKKIQGGKELGNSRVEARCLRRVEQLFFAVPRTWAFFLNLHRRSLDVTLAEEVAEEIKSYFT